MHTAEQATELWCPMARIAQIGAAETGATYNRALIKMHAPVTLTNPNPEGGEPPESFTATVLKIELQLSRASMCIANKCAMWRWADGADGMGHCGLAPLHKTA